MDDDRTIDAAFLRERFGLQPHPTCGYVAETYRSPQRVPAEGLPEGFDGGRPLGSALHFLVTPETHLQLHRIRSDQQYLFHLGDPLEVLQLRTDGSSSLQVVGSDLRAGQVPMLAIPGQTFHLARLVEGGAWSFLSSTEWPGVEPPDVEVGDPVELAARFPDRADDLRRLLG
jgi:uncharacterized protein